MKRLGNAWDKVTSLENIRLAHQKAKKGKSHYKEVQEFEQDSEHFCKLIQDMLVNKRFTTSQYKIQEIFDGRKQRLVHKLPYFPDRVIHHALFNVIGDTLHNSLIRDTFQSITNRGTSDAARRVKQLVRTKQPKYYLKLDVKKYYPSVNVGLLKQKLRAKIKCKDTLWLLDDILDSSKGLPIGNYSSQLLGNFYLSKLDWKIKQELKPLGYFRYCDDLVLFANTKSFLKSCNKLIVKELSELGLEVKRVTQIQEVNKQPVDFVGFVFKPISTRLRKSIKQGLSNVCKSKANSISSLMSYKGWCKQCNAKLLWRKHTKNQLRYRKQLRGNI